MSKKTYYPNQIEEVLSKCKQRVLFTQSQTNYQREYYTDLCCGFDIETTTLENRNAYMYVWQFSINEFNIIGRTWEEFITMLDVISNNIVTNKYSRKKKPHIIVWVANLGFEFQFIRKWLDIQKLFAVRERVPLYFLANDVFEFRDCLQITGGGLDFLAKNYTHTQKLVGDLDYTKLRNRYTPLTFKETKYIINDVRILSEFARYIFDNYLKVKHILPLTKTGIIRSNIKLNVTDKQFAMINRMFPDFQEYEKIIKYLFRGGYTHANAYHANEVIEDVYGFDFKSSYPFVMLTSKFPMSKFVRVENPNIEEYSDFDKFCYYFTATFKNIRKVTNHSIESLSKCMYIKGESIDNGRVVFAEEMKVMLTNYDYEIYRKLYRWDEIIIENFMLATVDYLPHYVTDSLIHYYCEKEKLSEMGLKDTPDYTKAKQGANSHYGMSVTQLHRDEIIYDFIDGWDTVKCSKTYEQAIKNQFLTPYHGIWITSIARYNLLQFLSLDKLGNDVVYNDTDSAYIINYEMHKQCIDNYNEQVMKLNYERFSGRPEYKYLNNLGVFDFDCKCSKFKTLGAKRYVKTTSKGTSATIAGLPKKSLPEYCEKYGVDIYEFFNDDMYLNIEYSKKNAHKYNDNYHCDYVDGVFMEERSSTGIYATTFELTLKDIYSAYIIACKEGLIKYDY